MGQNIETDQLEIHWLKPQQISSTTLTHWRLDTAVGCWQLLWILMSWYWNTRSWAFTTHNSAPVVLKGYRNTCTSKLHWYLKASLVINSLSDVKHILTYCGLVTPYGSTGPGQHLVRLWLVVWWLQAITHTNAHLSSARFNGIHFQKSVAELSLVILQEITRPLISENDSLTETWVNIKSRNGLMPDGFKPLTKPILTYLSSNTQWHSSEGNLTRRNWRQPDKNNSAINN